MKFLIIYLLITIYGCTSVTWKAQDGTELSGFSFLSDKKVSGSLSDDGKTRVLTIYELELDGTSGAAAITKAAVEGAVKGIKP